jgi:glycosyltransferase involved in cell wall biosynthesis
LTKFSVVLPVRNGWPWVQECVASILAQTYPHFDLIVLDNQSTDNTVPWLKSLNDSRIRLYYSSSALSMVDSWARITGVEKQEYMTLIGHDDMLDPGFLETVNRLIERFPDAKLYQAAARLIDSEGKKIRSCQPVPVRETPAQYLEGRFTYRRDISGTGVVMRSIEYDRIGGIPHFSSLYFADDALWLSLMRGGYKACDPAELVAIRMHSKKESTTKPSSWLLILRGLNSLSDFLRSYLADDAEARSAAEKLEPPFMLRYHRNMYILALLDACQSGRTIDPAVTRQIEESLAKCAPMVADRLRRSVAVSIIEKLNRSFLRAAVLPMWNLYHRYWMRAR